ncbi:ABC transporter substrate-binding protein [Streptomyces caniscabiei]|uniref:Carbohydrate ABC transporter substrate-binding protein n=1 Tax=Streptomyces caniscabiei TaxID=2746961 RepID=A0A927L8B2_9ACTN|nr:ABC transporter substrate-binding protein [Streptomyces caniscabiei]MBD9726918.1 carbohydrate ABC transporter substrate-binding protein [Streptomyces caniscabiei]MDX3513681.1 ABC transporter substrate-binding protein [Streptomyces caniscabiei]MDX3722628.1 ABC transporter substrate-binding protein [Streptomyces caniscabiei]WEO23338.1 ABC transporter substrate-binding protein [Streptomyces caniscabiei]
MPRIRTRESWKPRAAAAALALCALLTGCSGPDGSGGVGGEVVLRYTWWGNPDRAARTQAAVELFEKKNPGIDIQTSFAGYEAYKQKLATQAAGGDAPDVMQLDYRMIDQYASGGVLLDLMDQRSALDTAEFEPGLLATGKVDGKQYAVPQGRGTETMVYDTEKWKAAGLAPPRVGWTWSEWADAMRKVAEETGEPGGTDPGQSEDAFEIWLRGQGKALYTEDRRLGFDADDLTRWWTFTDRLRREGAVSPAEQTTQLDGTVENTPLGRGTAASDVNWDAPASGYLALVPTGISLAPMPGGEDGTPGQYFKPSMFMGVAADSGHPEESARLVDFLLNDEEAAKILGATRGIPVNESIRADIAADLKDFDRTIYEYQATVEGKLDPPPQAPPSGDSALQTTFQRDYDQVSYERMSPREAAENYLTEAKAELRS